MGMIQLLTMRNLLLAAVSVCLVHAGKSCLSGESSCVGPGVTPQCRKETKCERCWEIDNASSSHSDSQSDSPPPSVEEPEVIQRDRKVSYMLGGKPYIGTVVGSISGDYTIRTLNNQIHFGITTDSHGLTQSKRRLASWPTDRRRCDSPVMLRLLEEIRAANRR